jgi:L-fucose isomerase-like protein
MLKILPLASSFHSGEQVRTTVARISAELSKRHLSHRMLGEGPESPDALLVVTGGTEHQALRKLESVSGPALLLAHPDQNSLPASLEILGRLRQLGRSGRIILLNAEEEGFRTLERAARLLEAKDRLLGMRLGRIGAPSDWLVGSMPDPGMVRSVWGPEVVEVPLDALRELISTADAQECEGVMHSFRQGAERLAEPSVAELEMAARVGVALRRLVKGQRLDACTVRCFDLVKELQTTGCLALSALLDEGITAGCEGDLPAALTMAWMQAVTGEISFMANPQDLDPADNTLWLAHCTIARSMTRGYSLRSHFESSLGVGIQAELEPGPITLARIGGAELRELFLADGELLANGNSELRCRTQVQVRLHSDVRELLERPLGNHLVLIRGHWAERLREYHDLFIR